MLCLQYVWQPHIFIAVFITRHHISGVSNNFPGSEVPKVAWKSREIKLKQDTYL